MSSLNSAAWLIASGLLDSTRELTPEARHAAAARPTRTLRQRLRRRSA